MQLVAPCLVTPSAKKTAANNSRSNNQRTSLLRASALQRSSANLPRAQCGATSLFHMSTSRHLCLIGILNKTTTQLIPSQKKNASVVKNRFRRMLCLQGPATSGHANSVTGSPNQSDYEQHNDNIFGVHNQKKAAVLAPPL